MLLLLYSVSLPLVLFFIFVFCSFSFSLSEFSWFLISSSCPFGLCYFGVILAFVCCYCCCFFCLCWFFCYCSYFFVVPLLFGSCCSSCCALFCFSCCCFSLSSTCYSSSNSPSYYYSYSFFFSFGGSFASSRLLLWWFSSSLTSAMFRRKQDVLTMWLQPSLGKRTNFAFLWGLVSKGDFHNIPPSDQNTTKFWVSGNFDQQTIWQKLEAKSRVKIFGQANAPLLRVVEQTGFNSRNARSCRENQTLKVGEHWP